MQRKGELRHIFFTQFIVIFVFSSCILLFYFFERPKRQIPNPLSTIYLPIDVTWATGLVVNHQTPIILEYTKYDKINAASVLIVEYYRYC